MQLIATIKLSQVKVNAENPRTISGDKFQRLVDSILVFPKMLEIRPVVVDSTNVALGGNMRTNALNFISKMGVEAIKERLSHQKEYKKMTLGERNVLEAYWIKWLVAPSIHVIKADALTRDEQRQFIVKDNLQYGAWDYDMLANEFDADKLGEWGMDIWQPQEETDLKLTQPKHSGSKDEESDYGDNDGSRKSKADGSASLFDDEDDVFSVTLTFDKRYYSLMVNYLDGETKAVIADLLVRLAKEYADAHPVKKSENKRKKPF